MKNSVIVTGNLGYLGPIVVKKLREANMTVAGIDPNLYPAKLQWDYKPDIQVDRVEQLPKAFWDSRAVVHLAAISNDPMAEINEQLTYDTNVKLVAEIAEIFSDARHVLASSASVYGFNPENCIESSPVNPLSTYASSKIAAERILALANGTSVMLRFGTLWGASPNFRVDLAVNHFALEGVMNKKIVPASNARRPILHVEDAAKSIVDAVLGSPEQYNGIYNVTAENIEIHAVASKIADFMGVEVEIPEGTHNADGRSYFSATMRDPHLSPSHPKRVGDEVAMNQLVTCAMNNLTTLPRIEALKQLLAGHPGGV